MRNDTAPGRVLGIAVNKDSGDDSVADGVELFDGGDHGGSVPIPTLVSSGPDGAQTLVGNYSLEQLLKIFH